MADFPTARHFERRAKQILKEAEARGEPVYGIKPWYCSASIIEGGAKVAFVGANPGGGPQSEEDDRRLGYLERPYDQKSPYNAWLDDRHWEGSGSQHQQRAIEAFEILFGRHGRDVLRNAACFNVVPLRTGNVASLSQETWENGVEWAMAVLEHVAPDVVVCNGNGSGRSAWNVFSGLQPGTEEVKVYGTFRLKRGRVARGKLAGAEVIGLPHLARMRSITRLKDAARRLGFPRPVGVDR